MQRILVVDDERLVADTLSLIFRKHGFETKATYSADEAMDCAREFLPQLILCDISMPGKGGLELMQDVSREFPECRILVLTGSYAKLRQVREEASRLGAPTTVLTKPCQPADLLREAGEMLKIA